jgi:predicted ATPase
LPLLLFCQSALLVSPQQPDLSALQQPGLSLSPHLYILQHLIEAGGLYYPDI